jgi:hypothetical protein
VSASDNERIAYLSGEPVESLTPQERAELDELRALLEAPAAWEEPDAGLEDRVVAAIASEAARAPAADPGPAAAPASPKPTHARWRLRRPVFALGGLATAAAAIAVALVIALGGSSTQPLQFAMVVSGTSLAPGAHGSATLTKTQSGWRIELSATGLPHLANGRYYQAWLKNKAGILVPVGTFNDAKKVTLWSGAPVTQFRSFSVTVQQANGNPASSGKRVLVGIAHPVH